jgi:hypothetical protein
MNCNEVTEERSNLAGEEYDPRCLSLLTLTFESLANSAHDARDICQTKGRFPAVDGGDEDQTVQGG